MKSHWESLESIPAHGVGVTQTLRSCLPGRSGQSTRSTGLSDTSPMDEVDFCDCTNVTALKLVRVRLKALDLSALRQLRSLEYHFGTKYDIDQHGFIPAVEFRGLGGLSNLVVLLHGIRGCSSFIEEIAGLTNLQVLELSLGLGEINKYPDLKRLCSLQELTLREFRNKANSISGLDSGRMRHSRFLELPWCSFSEFPGLGDLVALEVLDLRGCRNLKELPNLQRLTRLRKLKISECKSISSLPGVGALIALEVLDASGCDKLSGSLDLSKLIHLQELRVVGVTALVGVSGVISLRWIDVSGAALEECRDNLQMLSELELVLVRGWSVEGLPCLSTLPKLEDIWLSSCKGVWCWRAYGV